MLAVAGNAAGDTVQRYSIPVLYSSYHRYSYHLPFISFQVQVSYSLTIFTVCRPAVWCTVCAGLLSGLQLCASCSATCCYCPTAFTVYRLSVLRSAIRHPFGARLFRLRRARSAYLAILYHYRHFHNYLMITVTYIFNFKGY